MVGSSLKNHFANQNSPRIWALIPTGRFTSNSPGIHNNSLHTHVSDLPEVTGGNRTELSFDVTWPFHEGPLLFFISLFYKVQFGFVTTTNRTRGREWFPGGRREKRNKHLPSSLIDRLVRPWLLFLFPPPRFDFCFFNFSVIPLLPFPGKKKKKNLELFELGVSISMCACIGLEL